MPSLGVISNPLTHQPPAHNLNLSNSEAVKSHRCRNVPDGVACPQSDPLWDGPVLLLGPGELLFRAEGFVALWVWEWRLSVGVGWEGKGDG